jgi:energy-coupling factor transport system permease protein
VTARQPGLAERAHPFTTGTIALALIALAIILPAPVGTLALYATTILIAAISGAGRGVRVGVMTVLPLWILLFVLQGILGDPPRVAAPWGGTLSAPGLAWTVSQGSRLATIITASAAFAVAFNAHRFLQAAIARRWPFGAAFLVVATLDAAERLGQQARWLREAQRARGVPVTGSLSRRARAIPALVFPLLLTALTEADDHALALETRGLMLPGTRTALDPPQDRIAERCIRWGALLTVVAAIVWRIVP